MVPIVSDRVGPEDVWWREAGAAGLPRSPDHRQISPVQLPLNDLSVGSLLWGAGTLQVQTSHGLWVGGHSGKYT